MVRNSGLSGPVNVYIILTIITICLMLAFLFKVRKEINSQEHHNVIYVMVLVVILLKLISAVIVCAALDYLCNSGHCNWAWFIIFSIFAIALLVVFSAKHLEPSSNTKKIEKLTNNNDKTEEEILGQKIETLEAETHPSVLQRNGIMRKPETQMEVPPRQMPSLNSNNMGMNRNMLSGMHNGSNNIPRGNMHNNMNSSMLGGISPHDNNNGSNYSTIENFSGF